jgi:ubiquinone/menaquinone biosynthesis C-methylase UbiE
LGVDVTSHQLPEDDRPPVCDYEGSDYQARFWGTGGREYEDRCEAIALKRLLPAGGELMLELGAGAGRNTLRYQRFKKVILLDYSRSQLRLAQERLGQSRRFIFVAADIYRLPFVDNLFDATTMIRTLHHMADAPAALRQVRNVLRAGGNLILEYANKRNIKAILRYALNRQEWNPFSLDPVEFAPLNFDFHPRTITSWLKGLDFHIESVLTVSHFRIELLKRIIRPATLAGLDSLLQWTGAFWQFSPSVFLRARKLGDQSPAAEGAFFKCLECGHAPLDIHDDRLECPVCHHTWLVSGGIYDFRGEE